MSLVRSFLSKKLNYIKKRFLDSALIQNWRRDVETDGFDCYATRKLLLMAMMVVIVIIYGFGLITGRLSVGLAYLAMAGRVPPPERNLVANLPPIFKVIADCESGGRQFDDRGRVVRGRKNRFDIGLYQINEVIHKKAIKETGFDIYTEEGNTNFAAYLYDLAGLEPWRNSKSCWGQAFWLSLL
ncbi:MAG: hypothetical protein Q7R86_01835 [bacterium]|nr:hypothetical protein [bacterium]